MSSPLSSSPCPCGSGLSLAACCGPLHDGRPAPNAETLMRARYSAYVLGRTEYLLATWHASTRPATLALDTQGAWLGLSVKAHRILDADRAMVEFVARYKIAGRAHRLHERSNFVREGGQWFYVDAQEDRAR